MDYWEPWWSCCYQSANDNFKLVKNVSKTVILKKKFQNSSETKLSPVLKKSQKVPNKNLEQPKKRPKPKWKFCSPNRVSKAQFGLKSPNLATLVCFCAKSLIFRSFFTSRGVFRFLKPGWLRGENVVQVKHFDACTLYFLKNRGGQNHPNHPGNYTSEYSIEYWIALNLLYRLFN